jgi:acyl-CoA reductase-like NAD-dependent aldehyde dehydrogenase
MAFLEESTWRGKVYSGGWRTAAGGDAPVTEPATGEELGRTGIAGPADVAAATTVAAAAQAAWAATPHTERAALLRRAGDIWKAHAEEIEQWSIREGGKIPPAAQFETHVATEEVYEAATLPSRPYGELLPSESPHLSFAERVPAGVVGVIAPFNFPQILAIRSVAPALALGNAVVLKPDPRTAVCGGVVHEAVYDDYVAALAGKAEHLPVGNPATEQVALGPVIDAKQRDKVHGLVTGSVDAGARLAAGGTYEGLFYRPTVLPAMPAYASEVFGPVAPVLRFATADEAAKLAADTEYGLSLGILTRDVMRGLDLARRIPTGIAHINDQTVDDAPNTPFGGIFASGTGARFGGTANLDAFTDTRWVTMRADIAPYPF